MFELISNHWAAADEHDAVYYVSFVPVQTTIPIAAEDAPRKTAGGQGDTAGGDRPRGGVACAEGIEHVGEVRVRIQLQGNNLAELLRLAGATDYRRPKTVSAATLVSADGSGQSGVLKSVRSAVYTYIQSQSIAKLQDKAAVTKALDDCVKRVCVEYFLDGRVEFCELTPLPPPENQLAFLQAQAGFDAKLGANGVKTVTFKDQALGPVVSHFIEVRRQKELQERIAEWDRDAAEEEPSIAKTKRVIDQNLRDRDVIKSNSDKQIFEATEAERVASANATAKEAMAGLERTYKVNRKGDELALIEKDNEIEEKRAGRDEKLRTRKQKEQEVEREHEEKLADIRTKEIVKVIEAFGGALEKAPANQGIEPAVQSIMDTLVGVVAKAMSRRPGDGSSKAAGL